MGLQHNRIQRNSSVDFLYNCFPSLMGALPTSTVDTLFPESTDRLCPTPTLAVGPFTISWPCLIPLCALGVYIGLQGGNSNRTVANPYISNAFFFFALMNASAFLAHSIFVVPTNSNWWLTYNWDMAATSASSFNLILGTLHIHGVKLPSWLPAFSVFGYMPLCIFLLHLSQLFNIPWIPELLYIFVTCLAGSVMLALLVVPAFLSSAPASSEVASARRALQLKALAVVCGGVAIFAAGPPMDRFLCRVDTIAGGWGLGNMLVPAFGGCDLAFWGLANYMDLKERKQDKGRQQTPLNKKSK